MWPPSAVCASRGRLVHREPDISLGAEVGVAGVDAEADAQRRVMRPGCGLRRAAELDGRGDRVHHVREHGEEAAAVPVDLDPAVLGEHRAHERVVERERVLVAVASERVEHARRSPRCP